jgi:WD40 repeat protein
MGCRTGIAANLRLSLGCILLLGLITGPFSAAQSCSPPVLAPSHALNLFNEQQEYDLGEVFAEHISFSLHVIEDEAVAGYLQQLGNRLVAQMPPTKIHFRFFLVDSPEANAFAIPGGRVYVTRKLIATVRSEDELAGVIGHEMGHQLAHHGALDWSRIFHDDLRVTQVGDRADIEDKYNQYLDTYRTRGSSTSSGNEENEQTGADQVAVYAVARAGYSPQAVIDFWDRFAETKGKQGSWLTDVFRTTRPESKRLRDFVKDLSSLPAGCIRPADNAAASGDFARWQAAVRNYNGFGKKESLHRVASKRPLTPVLRADIKEFRFSPDGKYLLAQDSSSIFVLTRNPLASLFRIDAPDAVDAGFSPDSRYVVFSYEGLRSERWNIAEQRLEDVREPYIYGGCVQAALSPGGDFLACLRPDRETYYPLTFTLYNLDTGNAVLTKKDFIGPVSGTEALFDASLELMLGSNFHTPMVFSPDGHYFVLGFPRTNLMVDLRSMSEVKMPGALRRVTQTSFAFVGPDKIVGAESANGGEALVVKFPSGDIVSEHIRLGGRDLFPVTQGDFAIVRPMLKAPLGIMDLDAKTIFRGSHKDATDVFGDVLVSERVNGEVALYRLREEKPFATLVLPSATLGRLSAASVAAHASAIAFSQMSRGGLWNLQTGEQVGAGPGFRGVFFGSDGVYMDFPTADQYGELPAQGETVADVRRREAAEPGDTVARLDLSTHSATPISVMKKRTHVLQIGSVVLASTPADDDKPGKDVTLEARDAQTGSVLWSRHFAKGLPGIDSSPDSDVAVFSWALGTKRAKDELAEEPEAKRQVNSLKDEEGSYLVEVINLRSGVPLGKFPIETGSVSFTARHFLAAGGTVAMLDSHDRVSLYSYKGERKGRLFGGNLALSLNGNWLCVEREPGRLILYDVERLRTLDEMTFGSRVSYVGFTPDSSQFVVLTADQTAYVFASRPAAAN